MSEKLRTNTMTRPQLLAAVLMMLCSIALAQDRLPGTAHSKAQMIVTVEPRQGKQVPVPAREDVLVSQNRERLEVTDWAPCQGAKVGLELFILIDDASDTSLGSQFQDIRDFIDSQPPSAAIGVGYMRNGIVEMAQNLTKDHRQAATSLRLPMGSSVGTNPYSSVSELIHHWPSSDACREILMVTPGVGAFDLGNEDFHNVFVDAAIADAQRAGIIVYAIYALGIGHTGHSLWFNLWAQNYLARVAEETGGEAYSLGFGAPVSLAQDLSDLTIRLAHQYLVSFVPKPGGKSGFQPVKLTTEVPNAELVSAPKFYFWAEP
jgi:hypothetical protein